MARAFQGVPTVAYKERETGELLARLLDGKLNATLDVTLTASVGSTAVTDGRIGPNSFLALMPQTANAAAEIGNGTLYVSARSKRSATLTHANNAQTDRTFTMLIIG